MRSAGLKTKLQLSFLLVGFVSVSVTGWQSFENAREALEKVTFDRLTSIRETKKRQIESYLDQIRNQLTTLAEDRMIVEAMGRFAGIVSRLHRDQGEEFGSRLRIALQNDDTLRTDRLIGNYRSMNRVYHPILQNYVRRFRYEDILLVDAQSGDVVYSVARKADFPTNLLTGPYSGSNIKQVFAAVADSPKGFVRMVDFAPYAASDSLPASFIAAPIFDEQARVGVVILRISLHDINNVMTSNNNWKAEGLGETGETYIVGEDLTMRNDSRFFIQQPESYFMQLFKNSSDSASVRRIQARATSILLQEVRTPAALDALNGHKGTRIVQDYRNVSVLTSYAPLDIPGVHWVMLAEMDASEAFHFVYELKEKLILGGLVILLLAGALGVFISQTISRPILSLAKVTERFGKGDLASRAVTGSSDEIGVLASGFNAMANNIAGQTTQLQREVEERTRAEEKLKISRQRLRNLSAYLQSAREEERKSLAREIHDELGQALSTLKLNLSLLRSELSDKTREVEERLSSIYQLIDSTIRSVKRFITELRPRLLDDLGLTAALQWQAEDFQRRTGIACSVSFSPAEIIIDPDRSTALFRIFQETLTNAARHSEAKKVTAHLTESGNVVELVVIDDGKGIAETQLNAAHSFGLLGIRERARYWGGSAEIAGVAGKGTTVSVRINIFQEEDDDGD